MGISLETSGIKVGDDKCYLVNLNADPALNELLVYYLKVRRCRRTDHSALVSSQLSLDAPPRTFLFVSSNALDSSKTIDSMMVQPLPTDHKKQSLFHRCP